MFTNFEEYAATQMLGQPDSPPRSSGKLYFSEDWQRTLFGMAMALSKAAISNGKISVRTSSPPSPNGNATPAAVRPPGITTNAMHWPC